MQISYGKDCLGDGCIAEDALPKNIGAPSSGRRTVDPSDTALVCSAHFRPSMMNTTMNRAQLREGAIPELVDLPSHLQVGLL